MKSLSMYSYIEDKIPASLLWTFSIYSTSEVKKHALSLITSRSRKAGSSFDKHRHHEPYGSTSTTARAAHHYPKQHGQCVLRSHCNHRTARFRHCCSRSLKIAAGALVDFFGMGRLISDGALADRRLGNTCAIVSKCIGAHHHVTEILNARQLQKAFHNIL